MSLIFSSTKKQKIVKIISECTESTYLLLKAFNTFISRHNPCNHFESGDTLLKFKPRIPAMSIKEEYRRDRRCTSYFSCFMHAIVQQLCKLYFTQKKLAPASHTLQLIHSQSQVLVLGFWFSIWRLAFEGPHFFETREQKILQKRAKVNFLNLLFLSPDHYNLGVILTASSFPRMKIAS